MRYYIDPFGCAKNQVDAENMMAFLDSSGWTASEPEEADLIIVNSCGFIESAKQESLNAVFALRKQYPKKKILLAGCLAQRYGPELEEALPEADLLFGNTDLAEITLVAARVMGKKSKKLGLFPLPGQRPLLSLPGSAYVKISEGCNNRCSYCAIPNIRGKLRSRTIQDIRDECKALLDRGIKELCLIGQDLGSYGHDFGAPALPALLKEISLIKGDFWIRLLYIHPDHFPLSILNIVREDRRFLPYFDLPFQHGSQKILGLMNRQGNAETYLALIETIRETLPDAAIRSTLMTGFPGETDDDFQALLDFQEKAQLDWMGCFTYSREENTPAYSMEPRIAKKAAAQRKRLLEERQIPITEKRMDRFVGQNCDVLIEEKIDGEEGLWLGRLPWQAPEVDGSAVISSDRDLKAGAFVPGLVFARAGLDLDVRV
jgi:ribosomal protein S12 methylthiotransferase